MENIKLICKQELFEDTLKHTFVGSNEELDLFMLKLEEIAEELAKEYGVVVE